MKAPCRGIKSEQQCLQHLPFLSVWQGYSYERLDGSVRGEERHLAIKNFGQQPIFVFLLSTRAGKERDRGGTKMEVCYTVPVPHCTLVVCRD